MGVSNLSTILCLSGDISHAAYRLAMGVRDYPASHEDDSFFRKMALVPKFVKAASIQTAPEFYTWLDKSTDDGAITDMQADFHLTHMGTSSYQYKVYITELGSDVSLLSLAMRLAVVDMTSRGSSPMTMKLTDSQLDVLHNSPPLIINPVVSPSNSYQATRTVVEDHIDLQGHLNVSWYYYITMECLAEAVDNGYFAIITCKWQDVKIQNVSMLLQKECVLGDELDIRIWLDQENNNNIHVTILQDENAVASLSFALFQNC